MYVYSIGRTLTALVKKKDAELSYKGEDSLLCIERRISGNLIPIVSFSFNFFSEALYVVT